MDDLLDRCIFDLGHGIQDALDKLPSGLGNMYSTMLLDHSVRSGVPKQLQLFILQWVTHASRPLCLHEIATIIDFVQKITNSELLVQATGVPKDTNPSSEPHVDLFWKS